MLTIITATQDKKYHTIAQQWKALSKCNHVYGEKALWATLFNNTISVQIITDTEMLFPYQSVLSITKWCLSHNIPVAILFTDSSKTTFKFNPTCNRQSYNEQIPLTRTFRKKTVTLQTNKDGQKKERILSFTSSSIKMVKKQQELSRQQWEDLETEVKPLKQYIKAMQVYRAKLEDAVFNHMAWKVPLPDQLSPKDIQRMEDFTATWARPYGLNSPSKPTSKKATPVSHRNIPNHIELTQLTEECNLIKHQEIYLEYIRELCLTYQSLRYYRAEAFPMLPNYVICPVCQGPINTDGRASQQIYSDKYGCQFTVPENEIACEVCGEVYNQAQTTKLMDEKYIQEHGSLEDQYIRQGE